MIHGMHFSVKTLPFGHFALYGLYIVLSLAVCMVGLASLLHRKQTRDEVASSGLFGVVGKFGQGKSYFLVKLAYDALRSHRAVYSNFPVKGCTAVHEWSEILAIPPRSMMLIDEAHLWWPSSSWGAPVEVKAWITQLRHRRITVIWSSQSVTFVARWLRELSAGVYECKKIKRGHQYTLYESHLAGSHNPNRERTARMYFVRSAAVMSMYLSEGEDSIVSSSTEWGTDSANAEGSKRIASRPPGRAITRG